MTSAQLVPALIIPFVAWRIYYRIRRTIGRQTYRPGRMTAAIIFFSALTLVVGAGTLTYLPALGALGGGLVLGIPLALYGLHLTRFEFTPGGKYYTPNTGIGVALTVLFFGRMAYRMYVQLGSAAPDGLPPPLVYHSPLTLLIFGVTTGYYITYYAGARRRGSQPA